MQRKCTKLVPTTLSNGSICWKYKQNNLSVPGTFQSERVRARSVWYISPQNQFFFELADISWAAAVPRMVTRSALFSYPEKSDDFCSQFWTSQTQSFASAHAKLCICSRKALHSPSQSFAFALAKLCICPRKALLENHLASMLILRYCNSLRIMCNIQTNKQFQNFTRLVKKSRRRYFTKMVKNSHCLLL